jgi:PAS domain S-box-containing protein
VSMLSEKTFRTIFNDTTDGILVADVESRQVFMANKVFCEMIGYSEQELKGFTIEDIHPSEDFAQILETFKSCLNKKLPVASNIPFQRKNGSLFYADVHAFHIHSGNMQYIMGILRDVTYRKRIEDELLFKTTLLETQLETSIDGILVVDENGKVVLFNKQFAKMWLISKEIMGEKDDKKLLQYVAEEIKEPEKFLSKVEYLYIHKEEKSWDIIELKDGRTFDRYSSAMIGGDGRYLGRIWYFRDISDYRKAEEALRKSEDTFRLAMEVTNDALWDWNLVTNEVYRNPRHATMLGYAPGEFSNKHEEWISSIHPDEKEKVTQIVNEVLNGDKKPFKMEHRLRKKTGDYIWVLCRGKAVEFNEKGQPLRIVGTNIDITERKKTEEALRESENKYKALIESAGETIAVINEKGEFLYMNEIAAVRLGGKPDEFIGKTMWDIFPKEIADRQITSIRSSITQKKSLTETSATSVQDGLRWFETTITPLESEDEKVPAAIIYARDITENKRTQEKLNDYRDEVAHADRLASLGTLSATAAHELAQPLTVVNLLIENALAKLEKGTSPQTVISKLRESLVEISNITSVVNRLRNFARKSSEQVLKEVHLKAVATRIVNLLSENFSHSGVKLIVSDIEDLPPVIANEKDLEQLFFALIDNAIYAAGDRQNRQVIISGTTCGEYIELRFADNCGGIAPENRERIFEPFFTTKPSGKGTGLGLCIVRDIVSRAGGKIRVESVFGEGSTFIITLPLNNCKK